jgi:hypothetical protein
MVSYILQYQPTSDDHFMGKELDDFLMGKDDEIRPMVQY